MSQTFCPLPWIFLSLRSNGEYRLCSHANQSVGKGLLRNERGELLRADQGTLAETRNSFLSKETRMKMLKGEWPEACVRCRKEESAGLTSRREIEAEVWKDHIDYSKARSFSREDGFIDSEKLPLGHIDLRFGNKCNLKCRSCGPTESSLWRKDHVELWGDTYDESTYQVSIHQEKNNSYSVTPDHYGWYESDSFLEEMKKVLPSLKSIYFAGGEPLLIDRHYWLLEHCVENGYAPNMILEYNTNLTVLPQKVIDLWRHFKTIKVGVSVDGVGAVNEYIRHPSKWETLVKNMHRLDQAPGNFILWLAPTVMVYNILDLPNMMIWKLKQGFRRINSDPNLLFFSPHPLHRPHFLNIQSLPSEVKNAVREILLSRKNDIYAEINKAFKDEFLLRKAKEQADQMIDGYISFMFQQDLSSSHRKFFYFTRTLDRLREEALERSIPDLYKLLLACAAKKHI